MRTHWIWKAVFDGYVDVGRHHFLVIANVIGQYRYLGCVFCQNFNFELQIANVFQ